MRVIIAGTRTISNYEVIVQAIAACPFGGSITEVVSGAHPDHVEMYLMGKRKGNPDIFGAVWARTKGIPVRFFPADWHRFDKAAGPIRNYDMALHADGLILVWTGNSKGSANMLEQAMKAGYPREHIHEWPITEEQLHAAPAT